MSRARPPGPDGLPVVGNTHQFLRDPKAFYETCAEYGDVSRARIAGDEVYVVTHPDLVRRVLSADDAYRRPDLLHDGGRPADDRWWRLRASLEPTFTVDYVAAYADATVRHAETMAALWDDGETVPVDEAMQELALDVFLDALFGPETDRERRRTRTGERGEREATPYDRLRAAVDAFDDAFEARSRSAFVPDRLPTRTNRRYRRALAAFDDPLGDLVKRRRATGFEQREDVLSALLRAGNADGGLDERAVRDRLVTVLVAGHETAAAALTFTAYALATHPGVADRLQAEVDAVLGPRSATTADVPRLGYTGRVVEESLRRYPPLYATFRRSTRETELADYAVSPDTVVVAPQYVVHNDARWFTGPETFRPERWADWAGPEYAYFPFGRGARGSAGMRFAIQELKLVVATMAQQVTFEPAADGPLELSFGTTLRPAEGLDLVVRERVATPRR